MYIGEIKGTVHAIRWRANTNEQVSKHTIIDDISVCLCVCVCVCVCVLIPYSGLFMWGATFTDAFDL